MESKKYIVVKNHVREIKEECSIENSNKHIASTKKSQKKKTSKKEISSSSEDSGINNEKNSNGLKELKTGNEDESSENSYKIATSSKKTRIKRRIKKQTSLSSEETTSDNEICASDLEELKAVYKKCKDVMAKIESKYGHLMDKEMNQNGLDKISKRKKIKHDTEYDEKSGCNCTSNKKIYFSDNGQEILEDGYNTQNHICLKRLDSYDRLYSENNQHIEVEYENENFIIPETIQELTDQLKNPFISNLYRNSVIGKIKSIRNENANILRFHKAEIIQNLKTNPDESLCFPGANLSSLPGYPK